MQPIEKDAFKIALNEKKGFHVWWRLLRPHTLTASFIPVFIGTMMATLDQSINFLLFLAMLLASMLIQSATNMFNEYYDFVRGLDNEESVGIGGTIVRDGVQPKTVLQLALIFFIAAMLLGVYICLESSWWVCAIGLVCMLFGYLYTGGPYPLAYTPFGELFAGFFMGTIIIGISYYIQTLSVTGTVLLISVPISIFIGTIMLSNNIRDLKGDEENGRKTIAILIGHNNAVNLLGASFVASYLITFVYIIIGIFPLWSMIAFLSIKKAWEAFNGFKGKTKNIEMMSAMKATAQTNTIYGLLLGLSLLLQLIFSFTL
ncbi:1,4-dihydroxy-2-naphthoate polyprenyltransferase [Aquibacillus halophilus]|uniref:1,4-dihydroxy-2-naphthoate octaprenyltransferase n=1 Tax=Aquibacillus halophilus TaxID=930132 RepID=A0A6A8DLY5_9BACI|nr:1,4-dihydroxy-2-naphthoate polyprenyltransferase [Aquibacillus halophilus]MRH44779.1 1,4-dihydroxy-2-naphthoate polyprenyltransferase [Aquibacillus halophilus]